MTRIDRVRVEPLDLALHEPFEIALGVQHEASNLLVTVETTSGVKGYGEGSLLPPVTGETQAAAVATARAADEAVFTPADALAVARVDAADVINVKLGKSGLLAAREITAIASAANLDLMVGCMLESAVGIHASAHVVAGLGTFDHVDLDGNRLLAEDVVPTADGPLIDIGGPGHGIAPRTDS